MLVERWVEDANDAVAYLDNELLSIRKDSFNTVTNLNECCKDLEKNKKEEARLREKSRLLELKKEIENLRKQVAMLSYQSNVRATICKIEAVVLILSLFSRVTFGIILCLLAFLAGLFSLVATCVLLRKSSNLIVTACIQYGVIEANIKVFDYRELETIDLDRLPFGNLKYDRVDLAGPL